MFSLSSTVGGPSTHGSLGTAPQTELEPLIQYYWHLGFPDTKIADHALDHFDHNTYGLRYVTKTICYENIHPLQPEISTEDQETAHSQGNHTTGCDIRNHHRYLQNHSFQGLAL